MTWQTRVIRITAFPPQDAEGWAVPNWKDLTGNEPENQATPQPGVRVQDGPFASGRIVLQKHLAMPKPVALVYGHPIQNPPHSLGPLEEALNAVKDPAERLLNAGFPIGRLALAIEFFELTTTIEEAFALLGPRIDAKRFDLTNAR